MSFSGDDGVNESISGEHIWLSANGVEHYLRLWTAPNPSAFILYLHGIEGHSLWFQDTAAFLQENGITTVALDRRGSGMSRESRGDAKNWEVLLDDVSSALRHVKQIAESRPLFLMANCWGAKLATILAQNDRPEAKMIDGLILSSPAIEVKVDLPILQKLKVAWQLATGNRQLMPIPLEIKDFTNNPKYLSFIEEDKLRLTHASAHFFLSTLILTFLSKQSAEKIETPTLIVQSGIDTIVETTGVRRWFERLKARDKVFKMFDDAHHSLDFHHAPHDYRKLLLSWLQEHSGEKAILSGSLSVERI